MNNYKNKIKIDTIVTVKLDGSVVVTEQVNNNSYNQSSEEAVVGKFWRDYRRR